MKIDNELNSAIKLHQEGQIEQACIIYNRILKSETDNLDVIYLLAQAYFQSRQFENALVFINKALNISKRADFYKFIGDIHISSNEFDKSLEAYQKSLELDPSNGEVYYYIGIISHNKGNINDAVKHYQKAIELNPNLIDAYNNLGTLFLAAKEYDTAINYFKQVLNLDKNNINAYFNLGNAYRENNDLNNALDNYFKVLCA